jgi:cullin-associated NEDD8-dissociated protein 1
LLAEVLTETSPLISDNDLELCRQGLSLVSLILDVCPAIILEGSLLNKTLTNILLLAQSPLIQGPTLEALKIVLGQLTRLNSAACKFDFLFQTLLESTSKSLELSKHALLNMARCIAVICLDSSPMNQKMAFRTFVDYLTPVTTEIRQILALYCLGEFGRQIQLKDFGEIKDNVVACFGRNGEEIKSAAAYSLGNICIGNMEDYFDSIIQNLQGQDSYLLLTSLREVIAHYSVSHSNRFSSYIDQVTPVLQTLSDREEEGIRNVVAECLGKLATMDGNRLLPIISDLCGPTQSPRTRWTAVTSIKHLLQGPADSSGLAELQPRVSILLSAISDDDLQVRRAGLLATTAAAHHHPLFILPFVKAPILPALLSATEIKLERVVDLGPFKHKVDDGLPLRKAAYACIDTLLETLPEEIDVNPMFGYLQNGLRDHDDVQILCHQILVKICRVKPSAILFGLDVILEPLEKTTGKKIKEDQVGTEVERMNDLIRSALRAVFAISLVHGVDHPKFKVYFDRLQNTETLCKMLVSIKSERFDGAGTRN